MKKPNRLVGLMGAIGSGKSTLADYLCQEHQFQRKVFANALKHAALDVFEPMGMKPRHVFGTQADKNEPLPGIKDATGRSQTGRRILEHLGTEGFRAIDPDVWVKHVIGSLDWGRYVIEDVRFPNEAKAIRDLGGQIWRIEKLGMEPEKTGHISDTAWHEIEPDHLLAAPHGNLEALYAIADALLEPTT